MMLKKLILGLTLSVTIMCQLQAQQVNPHTMDVGDQVSLELRGDASREYARLVGMAAPESDFSVNLLAHVSRKVDNNNLEITFAGPVRKNASDNRLVTVTAIVDTRTVQPRSDFRAPYVEPRNELEKGVREIQRHHESLPVIQSPSLKNLLIRTWTMVEESGKL